MRCWNERSAVIENSRALLFGIIYPAICITCALVLAQRIRRRQRRKYMQLERQMETPSEKTGGERSSGATNAEFPSSMQSIYDRSSLPSACDILLPLSHTSPLPSSGYLAAMLRQERVNVVKQSELHESQSIQPDRSSGLGSGDSARASLRTPRSSEVPLFDLQSSPTQSDESSRATYSSPRQDLEQDGQGLPSSPGSDEFQSVQKRSQQVHFLHDVDEEGVRSWRRSVIEYS